MSRKCLCEASSGDGRDLQDATLEPDAEITVEVRLSAEALAQRISAWLEQSGTFVAGAAKGRLSVMIADHIPDDAESPVVLLATDDEHAAMPRDPRVAARLSPEANLTKIRIALEAAAHGLTVGGSPSAPSASGAFPPLSARELEVLQHLTEGASNKAIARMLGISAHTVKFHVAAILEKLGAGSRTEAATQAIRAGLFIV
jgi:DNA-binding CsgD family transcriptional regulator